MTRCLLPSKSKLATKIDNGCLLHHIPLTLIPHSLLFSESADSMPNQKATPTTPPRRNRVALPSAIDNIVAYAPIMRMTPSSTPLFSSDQESRPQRSRARIVSLLELALTLTDDIADVWDEEGEDDTAGPR